MDKHPTSINLAAPNQQARGFILWPSAKTGKPDTPGPITRVKLYKGKAIYRLFPSGMHEIYSDKKGRFLRFDTLEGAKQAVREDMK